MSYKYNMQYFMPMTFSEGEILRRHEALKQVMREENIPAAIVFSRDGAFKSWLLGKLTQGFAGAGDILIADGPSYSVAEEFLFFDYLSGEDSFEKYVAPADYDNVFTASRFSYIPIQEAMRRSGANRIGVYRPAEMNIGVSRYLERNIPEAVFVDLTESFDRVRMSHSAEELAFARKAAWAVDRAFMAIPAAIQAGITEYECVNRIRAIPGECAVGDMGSYMLNDVKLTSNPDGQPLEKSELTYPGRYLQKGDRVDVTFHCACENWVYGMASRSFILADDISEVTQSQWGVARGASNLAASLLKPGACLKRIAGRVNAYLAENGSETDASAFLYSLYNGIQEVPCLYDCSENMALCEGALIAVRPSAVFGGGAPMCCGDVYMVTPSGGERLGSLCQDIVPVRGLW